VSISAETWRLTPDKQPYSIRNSTFSSPVRVPKGSGSHDRALIRCAWEWPRARESKDFDSVCDDPALPRYPWPATCRRRSRPGIETCRISWHGNGTARPGPSPAATSRPARFHTSTWSFALNCASRPCAGSSTFDGGTPNGKDRAARCGRRFWPPI
jgi:hypothetical protein